MVWDQTEQTSYMWLFREHKERRNRHLIQSFQVLISVSLLFFVLPSLTHSLLHLTCSPLSHSLPCFTHSTLSLYLPLSRSLLLPHSLSLSLSLPLSLYLPPVSLTPSVSLTPLSHSLPPVSFTSPWNTHYPLLHSLPHLTHFACLTHSPCLTHYPRSHSLPLSHSLPSVSLTPPCLTHSHHTTPSYAHHFMIWLQVFSFHLNSELWTVTVSLTNLKYRKLIHTLEYYQAILHSLASYALGRFTYKVIYHLDKKE